MTASLPDGATDAGAPGRPIPAGLVGEVRRTQPGGRLQIDHRHEEAEFDLVVRGAGGFTIGETTYALAPGTLIWQAPGRRHRLLRSPKLEMWVVSLRPELIERDWLAEIAAQPSRQLPGEELVDLDRLLSQVAQDSDDPATYNAGLTYALRRAQRASRDKPPAHVKPLHPAVARALLLLRESGAALSLPALASASGIAAPYLSRLLKAETNRSFVEWRNRIRLERFMEAFQPEASLLALALDAGFGSYARFHRVFTQTVGCTPGEWARQSERAALPTAAGDAALPAYGLAGAGNLSARQRWLQLVPLVSPAIATLLGHDFLARLAAAPSTGAQEPPPPTRPRGLSAGDVEQLLAALAPQDAQRAAELQRLIARNDFPGIYAGLLRAYGLSPDELSASVAAYVLLLWTAAADAADPGAEQVTAALRQVRWALPLDVERRDHGAARTALLCHFVVGYQALQAARASGDPRAREQLAQAARTAARIAFGGALDTLTLTAAGFAPA